MSETTWGVVTDDSPLTVQFAGDTAGTEVGLSAVRPQVGEKVILEKVGGQWICTGQYPDPGWTTATLSNSWAAVSGLAPRYRRKPDGMVVVEGAVEKNPGDSTVFVNLPAGFRPERQQFKSVPAFTGGAYTHGQVLIEADGDLFLQAIGASISGMTRVFIDLDFMAA